MGDLPAAGRYWFLTEHDDPRRAQAEAALYERHGRGALELIRALPVKASIEAYPPAVQERLHSLQAEVEQVGFRWVPGASRQAERAPKETRSAAWLGGAVAVLGCGVFLVGLVGTAVLLWRLLTAIF